MGLALVLSEWTGLSWSFLCLSVVVLDDLSVGFLALFLICSICSCNFYKHWQLSLCCLSRRSPRSLPARSPCCPFCHWRVMVNNSFVPGFRSVSVENEITNFFTVKGISKKGFGLSLERLLLDCASPCVISNVWRLYYFDDVGHGLHRAVREGWLLFWTAHLSSFFE